MPDQRDFARATLANARSSLAANLENVALDEALFAAGGYRSLLGVLKHLGGWTHVYRSYAFDPGPRHWAQTSWPRGLRDAIEPTADYFLEVAAWADAALEAWDKELAALAPEALDEHRSLHWGAKVPLWEIVLITAHHVSYHTGELNMLLSIKRGEAWEYTEEVEENHISTFGHGVRREWMSDDRVRQWQTYMRERWGYGA